MSNVKYVIILAVMVFMFGGVCNTAYSESLTGSPISGNPENHSQYTSYGLSGNERISPHDWIVENDNIFEIRHCFPLIGWYGVLIYKCFDYF
jgi:hypothetical protein